MDNLTTFALYDELGGVQLELLSIAELEKNDAKLHEVIAQIDATAVKVDDFKRHLQHYRNHLTAALADGIETIDDIEEEKES